MQQTEERFLEWLVWGSENGVQERDRFAHIQEHASRSAVGHVLLHSRECSGGAFTGMANRRDLMECDK